MSASRNFDQQCWRAAAKRLQQLVARLKTLDIMLTTIELIKVCVDGMGEQSFDDVVNITNINNRLPGPVESEQL